ncbi:MAG: DUF2066 domain-containing protein [Rhizobiales bacterium]|nr:DUF2066 domain-containing protein [Hyphomicrobiales bacterium]NRB12981.1 DUF2066 domain-containing protein [Hyphomicrobiales bacterium]
MIKFIRVLMTIIFATALSHAAGAESVYDVANIKVNATGKDGITAKSKALAMAEAKGVVILFDRLLTPGQKAKALARLDPDTRSLLVKAFSVKNEQSGGTQYIAEITIKFRQTAVQQFLANIGAKYSDSQSEISLLVPILTTADGKTVIWSTDNPWSKALQNHDLQNGLMPLKIVDSRNAGLLATEQEVLDKNENALYQLASAAGENAQIVFAHMTLDSQSAIVRVSGITSFNRSYPLQGADLNAIYEKAASDFLRTLVSEWRNNNITSKPQLAEFKALVVFNSLDQWITLRTRLSQIDAISEFDTDAMTAEGAFINVKYKGNVAALAQQLQMNGLSLIDLGPYFEIRG